MPEAFRTALLILIVLVASGVNAAAPPGYYGEAHGLRGEALDAALRRIIDGHSSLSYNGAKDQLWGTVEPTGGVITCIYSGRTSTNLNSDTNGMNAEHIWPQSRGAGSTPPRSDLHHLFVTDSTWNSRRGSLRFQNVSSPTATSPIGARVNHSQGFEPPDEYKGDVARAIFYFAVRYNRDVRNNAVLSGSNGSTADDHMGELDVLVEWHFNDPPSPYENQRNDRIFSIQGNRNPFIDNPDFVSDWLEFGPPIPSIATTTIPAVPEFDTATHLRADITSSVTIDESTVRAQWRIAGSGAFTEQPMARVSGNTLSGTWETTSPIPPLDGGTVVEYYVEATDTDGTSGRDPGEGQATFQVRAPDPPSITLSTLPARPVYDDITFFEAIITSELPIPPTGASVFYRIAPAEGFLELPLGFMGPGGNGGRWLSALLPPMPGGTRVQYYAVATDVSGTATREPAAGLFSFEVFESAPPAIAASTNPAAPRVGEGIRIVAEIISDEGVEGGSVTAIYTTSDGREGESPMALESGNIHQGVWTSQVLIDGLEDGATLSHAVAARDMEGRSARDPESGLRTVTVTAAPRELDISGYTLTETDANIVLTFPPGTVVPANGFVIVGRQADRQGFESFWGPLPGDTVYINAHDIVGGNGMVINGGEVFTLDDESGSRLDGPTATTGISARDARIHRASIDQNEWLRGPAAEASPGELELPGSGAGLVITEFCDPENAFEEAFVELYNDTGEEVTIRTGEFFTIY